MNMKRSYVTFLDVTYENREKEPFSLAALFNAF